MVFYILLVLLIICLCFEMWFSQDAFSPIKLCFMFFIINFGEIFLNPENCSPLCRTGCILYIIGLIIILFYEIYLLKKHKIMQKSRHRGYSGSLYQSDNNIFPFFGIWSYTLFALIMQVIAIKYAGGIEAYLGFFGQRQEGSGVIRSLIKPINIINVIYLFYLLVSNCKNKRFWYILYFVHLACCLLFGLLTGSRTNIMLPLLHVALILNYFHKKIRYVTVALAVLCLIPALVLWGTIRGSAVGGMDYLLEKIKTNSFIEILKSDFSSNLTTYGTRSFEIVSEYEFIDLQYGKTYSTALTNIVPRAIWPQKPLTGGDVLTRFQLDTEEISYSNSPGAIVEGILNFGYFWGSIFGYLVFLSAGFISCHLYVNLRLKTVSENVPFKKLYQTVYFYFIFFLVFPLIASGEFATLMVPVILLSIFYLFFTVLINPRRIQIQKLEHPKLQEIK